jgi:hypothetical protein
MQQDDDYHSHDDDDVGHDSHHHHHQDEDDDQDGGVRTPNYGDDVEAATEVNPQPLDSGRAENAETVIAYRTAKGLITLRNQLNARAPGRRKSHDGDIGDKAHENTNSDHNPWVKDAGKGVVTAIDITHDPANGCDANAIAEAIRKAKDPRVKYIIWNRRIANSAPMGGQPAWAWRPYTGKNPHDKHVHISVKPAKALYDSTTPWAL